MLALSQVPAVNVSIMATSWSLLTCRHTTTCPWLRPSSASLPSSAINPTWAVSASSLPTLAQPWRRVTDTRPISHRYLKIPANPGMIWSFQFCRATGRRISWCPYSLWVRNKGSQDNYSSAHVKAGMRETAVLVSHLLWECRACRNKQGVHFSQCAWPESCRILRFNFPGFILIPWTWTWFDFHILAKRFLVFIHNNKFLSEMVRAILFLTLASMELLILKKILHGSFNK